MTPLQQRVLAIRAAHPGWNNPTIAQAAGCTVAAVWKILNPERAREAVRRDNAKRGPAKRAWDDGHRAPCPECGEPMAAATLRADGSRCGVLGVCRGCEHVKAIACMREMVRLRRDYDMPNAEIAERLGMTPKSVATQLKDLRSLGLDVPLDPYNRPPNGKRKRMPRSVSSATVATVLEAFPELREVDARAEGTAA